MEPGTRDASVVGSTTWCRFDGPRLRGALLDFLFRAQVRGVAEEARAGIASCGLPWAGVAVPSRLEPGAGEAPRLLGVAASEAQLVPNPQKQ